MARNGLKVVLSLLFIIFLSQKLIIICVEGRNLKFHDEKGIGYTKVLQVVNHQSLFHAVKHEEASEMVQIDNFRPTKPGHSPGVGHAINN